jgi:hypothetical protein
MSRAATGDVVQVRAGLDVYTVLTLAAVLVQLIGLGIIFWRATKLEVKFF